jgi:alpha-ketoglutarate-dependent taurine dioxygenase
MPSATVSSPLPSLIQGGPRAAPEDLRALVERERAELAERVARVGALLFRGFGVVAPAELARVVDAAGEHSLRYVGGDSPRTRLHEQVYTSTECPAGVRIPLHSELSYQGRYPRHLWFACATPAPTGGETVIADARAIWRALDPEVRERFAARGVRYRYSFRGESLFWGLIDRLHKVTRTWREALETDDPRIAEQRSAALAAQHRWLPSGRLVLESVRPAWVRHPSTGEVAWFNQAHLFRWSPRFLGRLNFYLARLLFVRRETRSHDAAFGDGSPLDRATLDHLFEVMAAHAVPIRWQRGDVLWLDNLACMHGRNAFRGARRVLVTMTG